MRAPGQGTKIKNGWRVCAILKDEYGRDVKKHFERKTLAAAQNASLVYLAEHGRVVAPKIGGTLAELFEIVDIALWSQTGKSNRRNMNVYRRRWEGHLGSARVEDLDAPTLTRAIHAIAGGKSRSTIAKAAQSIRQALAYAVSDLGWRADNPGEFMRLPKGCAPKYTYPPFTQEEYDKMVKMAGARERLLIRLVGECAMRPVEALRVRAGHLFSVHDRWLVDIPKSKTAAGVRCVPVPDSLMREIQDRSDGDWEGIEDPLDHLRSWWRENSETRLYDMRGWRADQWRRMGLPAQLRTYLLGHTKETFTQYVYEKLTSEDTLSMFSEASGMGLSMGKKSGTGEI